MADINKLAILVNQADDLQEFAEKLDIDADIITDALINGESSLSRNDRLELGEKLQRYERVNLNSYEQAELEDYAELLNETSLFIEDTENAQKFIQAFAENKINLDELETANLFFPQGDNTNNVQTMIIVWLNESDFYIVKNKTKNKTLNLEFDSKERAKQYARRMSETFDYEYEVNESSRSASTFLSLFENDGLRMDRYGKESKFWEWFRETFYK